MSVRSRRAIILPKQQRRELTRFKMIKSIQIQGYRGFSEFEMRNLARVNLLVGTNNSGKTSALEALFCLSHKATLLHCGVFCIVEASVYLIGHPVILQNWICATFSRDTN